MQALSVYITGSKRVMMEVILGRCCGRGMERLERVWSCVYAVPLYLISRMRKPALLLLRLLLNLPRSPQTLHRNAAPQHRESTGFPVCIKVATSLPPTQSVESNRKSCHGCVMGVRDYRLSTYIPIPPLPSARWAGFAGPGGHMYDYLQFRAVILCVGAMGGEVGR